MYLGDYKEDSIINFKWSTNDAAGASITRATNGTVSVYKADGTTQSTAGITDTEDFDTLTGVHHCKIDTSADAFYAVGNDYQVVLSAANIDGQTVNAVIKEFSIENRFNETKGLVLQSTTIATLASQTSFTLTAGSSDNDAYNSMVAVIEDSTTGAQKAIGAVKDYTGSTKTVTLVRDPGIFTMATGDKITILATSTADTVWDEPLTGSTHNETTSSGRRVRAIQDYSVYEGGAVWIDTVNGSAGTIDFENGTITNPSLTLADALTIAASLNINTFTIVTGSTITLASTTSSKVFRGDRWTLALGGQDVSGSYFEGASVSGIATGTEAHYHDCTFNACTLSNTHASHCAIANTITVSATGDYYFIDCHSGIAGTNTPTIDIGAAVLDTNLIIRHYSGGVEIQNLGQAGTDTMSMEGNGQVIFNANCIGGTAAIRGNIELTNNGSGITIADAPRFDSDTLVDLVWDEVLTGGAHNISNSSGKILRELKELPGYEAGFIYIDTANGTSGSEAFVNGTLDNPVDNMTDANTIAAFLGSRSFKVISGSSITFTASQENQEFFGESWALALGSQSISGTFIHGADISGVCTGTITPKFEHCNINGVTLPACTMYLCGFSGDMVIGSTGDYFFYDCYSEVAGVGTPSIDFGAAIGNTNVNFRRYSGGMEVKNYNASGVDTMSLEGWGQLVVNANCTGGTIAMRGHQTITDNASGAVTFSDNARYDVTQVGDAVLDEVVEGSETLRGMTRLFRSVLLGITTGGGSTNPKFMDSTNSKPRVRATVDDEGNRSSVTVDTTD